jgi:hypothetical protein
MPVSRPNVEAVITHWKNPDADADPVDQLMPAHPAGPAKLNLPRQPEQSAGAGYTVTVGYCPGGSSIMACNTINVCNTITVCNSIGQCTLTC